MKSRKGAKLWHCIFKIIQSLSLQPISFIFLMLSLGDSFYHCSVQSSGETGHGRSSRKLALKWPHSWANNGGWASAFIWEYNAVLKIFHGCRSNRGWDVPLYPLLSLRVRQLCQFLMPDVLYFQVWVKLGRNYGLIQGQTSYPIFESMSQGKAL